MYHNNDQETITRMMMVFVLLFVIIFITFSARAQSREEIIFTIKNVAARNGIDPDLAVAIAEVESHLNPKATGKLGEVGIFQLRPEYHGQNIRDVRRNTEVAVAYLLELKDVCGAYGDAFFICFNLGPAHSTIRYPRKFKYYRKVMAVKVEVSKL